MLTVFADITSVAVGPAASPISPIVVVLPDLGERHISTALCQGIG
jgi:hypothetical protein